MGGRVDDGLRSVGREAAGWGNAAACDGKDELGIGRFGDGVMVARGGGEGLRDTADGIEDLCWGGQSDDGDAAAPGRESVCAANGVAVERVFDFRGTYDRPVATMV